MNKTDIQKIWIDENAIWIETIDGRIACEYLSDYARLKNARRELLENYSLSFYGIHWPELDEDLSFDGFFRKSSSIQQNLLVVGTGTSYTQ